MQGLCPMAQSSWHAHANTSAPWASATGANALARARARATTQEFVGAPPEKPPWPGRWAVHGLNKSGGVSPLWGTPPSKSLERTWCERQERPCGIFRSKGQAISSSTSSSPPAQPQPQPLGGPRTAPRPHRPRRSRRLQPPSSARPALPALVLAQARPQLRTEA